MIGIGHKAKIRSYELFNLLQEADYENPLTDPFPNEIKRLRELKKMGLVEQKPGANEWRRTEKGDNFLLNLFPSLKKTKKVK